MVKQTKSNSRSSSNSNSKRGWAGRPELPHVRRRGSFLVLLLLGAGCGERDLPPLPTLPPGAFAFGVTGDAPYSGWEERHMGALIDDVNAGDVQWLIHVGDIFGSPCDDALYIDRRELWTAVRAPVVYTPGDNEWADCHRDGNGGYVPLERLDHLRTVFFGADQRWSGVAALGLQRQSEQDAWPEFVENVRWRHGPLVAATVHMVGSRNATMDFSGRSPEDDAEVQRRTRAALAWIRETFAQARRDSARGVVLAFHTEPGFDGPPDDPTVFDAFLGTLAAEAAAFPGEVLLVHGDNHELHMDRPLRDGTGAVVENVRRLETYGSPDVGWVRVVVDTAAAELFRFEPRELWRPVFWH